MKGFAAELRLQCARRGSIAQLCKSTGINRQQFNKYLSGQCLPGTRTLRKICSYLGVSEEQLMSGHLPFASGNGHDDDFISRSSGLQLPHHSGLTSERPAPAALLDGFYRAYFPVPKHPNLVARWLVRIETRPDGEQIQTCRNHFQNAATLGYAAKHIRYQGFVSYGPDEACLSGTSHTPPALHGTIFVKLKPVALECYFSAMVLTRRPDGPIAMSGLMHFHGEGCSAREALAGLGVASLYDPETDPLVVQVMRAAPAAASSWLQTLSAENLRTATPPGSSGVTAAPRMRRQSV